jgi:prephenate dehydratase
VVKQDTGAVAYQGRPGAFSELAARGFVGPAASLLPCRCFSDVVAAVVEGEVMFGALPVCNSLAGVIAETCALIASAPVAVLDEIALPIAHALIAAPDVCFGGLRRVISHPVALSQCAGFFRRHPALRAESTEDTAGSVEAVIAQGLRDTAAIAAAHAADLYGASILAEHIEDSHDNYTTFLLIACSRGFDRRDDQEMR